MGLMGRLAKSIMKFALDTGKSIEKTGKITIKNKTFTVKELKDKALSKGLTFKDGPNIEGSISLRKATKTEIKKYGWKK